GVAVGGVVLEHAVGRRGEVPDGRADVERRRLLSRPVSELAAARAARAARPAGEPHGPRGAAAGGGQPRAEDGPLARGEIAPQRARAEDAVPSTATIASAEASSPATRANLQRHSGSARRLPGGRQAVLRSTVSACFLAAARRSRKLPWSVAVTPAGMTGSST